MQNKAFYILIGVLIGIIIILAAIKIPNRALYAANEPSNISQGSSDGVIAIAINTIRTGQPILWVLDVRRYSLLVYNYEEGSNRIKLEAFRDVKYDMDIPSGYAGFDVPKGQNPFEVKQAYEEARKKLTPPEAPKK